MDYSPQGRAGAAVGVLSNLKVLDKGVKGDGSFAWCTIDIVVGLVSVGSVYAPNERARRIKLCDWMTSHLHDGNWIFFLGLEHDKSLW